MHPHDHHHSDSHPSRSASSALRIAFFITAGFMGVEIVGGLFSNSLALLADAAHMGIDAGTMLLNLFAIWMASRPRTPRMSYGYHRFEILGALVTCVLIWAAAIGLVYEAATRFAAPPEVNGPMVIGVATFGLFANLIVLKLLHGDHHHHLNLRAAYLHVLSDLLGSVAAIISGLFLWLSPYRWMDPAVTCVVSVLMLASSWSLLRESIAVLLNSAPEHIDPEAVKASILKVAGVGSAHDLHIWSMASGRTALSVHLQVGGAALGSSPNPILARVNSVLKEGYGILHTTIQIETAESGAQASESCLSCDEDSHKG